MQQHNWKMHYPTALVLGISALAFVALSQTVFKGEDGHRNAMRVIAAIEKRDGKSLFVYMNPMDIAANGFSESSFSVYCTELLRGIPEGKLKLTYLPTKATQPVPGQLTWDEMNEAHGTLATAKSGAKLGVTMRRTSKGWSTDVLDLLNFCTHDFGDVKARYRRMSSAMKAANLDRIVYADHAQVIRRISLDEAVSGRRAISKVIEQLPGS